MRPLLATPPGGVPLHPAEGAVLDGLLPPGLVYRDAQKLGYAAHLLWHVALEVREIDEQDVREVAKTPPGPDVLPEGPEGEPVALQPLAEDCRMSAGGVR